MRFLIDNRVTQDATVITATSTNVRFPTSNLKNPLRSKVHRSVSAAGQSLVFDMLTTEAINSVVILWPKERGIRLTGGANIRIQANATNVWTSPAVDQALIIDNEYSTASHFFTTDQNYRYWRLYIDDPTNPDGYVEVGMVWLGTSLAIENAQNGFKFTKSDTTKVDKNDFGHRYYDEYPIMNSVEFDYKYLDYTTIKILETAFQLNGTKKPVIIVLDETDTVFDKDHFLLYGNMSNQFGMSHVRYNIFNQDGIRVEELS